MSEMNLSERLSKIQKELKCEKSRTNKFGGYYGKCKRFSKNGRKF